MSAVLEAKDLTVKFGKHYALHDLSLSVTQGSVCALLGPNGAGKTTLLKTALNLIEPSSGTIEILGRRSTQLSAEDFHRIGYVSEDQVLPDWMTIKRFLAYCASLYPRWNSEWCSTMVKRLELQEGQQIKALSRGTRMKVALISALAFHPEILILDEPFSGLDPIVRDQFLLLMVELAGQANASVILSSHDLNEVEQIADSIAIIKAGRLLLHRELTELQHKLRRVTVTLAESSTASLNTNSDWLMPALQGRLATFVHANYRAEQLAIEVEHVLPGGKITGIEELSLKDAYKSFVS